MIGSSACIPSNRLSSTSSRLSSSNLSVFPSLSSLDGAQGQCQNLITGSPERQFCVECYNTILSTRCPGQTSPSSCQDPAVATNFTNLVNQCVSQSMTAGFTCTTTCSAGTQLDPTSCTCVASNAPSPGTGGGGGSGGLIDTGQINYGPPVVTGYWPMANGNNTPGTASCLADITPIYFLIQNRGGTVPQLNQYSVTPATAAAPYCVVESYDMAGNLTYIPSETTFAGPNYVDQSTSPPTLPALSGNGASVVQFRVNTSGTNEYTQMGYGESIINESFAGALPKPAAPAVPRWSANAATRAINGSMALGSYANSQVTLDINSKPGYYYLRFDLYTLDTWEGDSKGTRFGVNINNSSVFLQSFTNNFMGGTQTYYTTAASGNLNADGGAISDRVYHIELTFFHSGGPMTISFFDENLTSVAAGSWAIDNLAINRALRRKCGLRYSFTDSNALTSSYCLRFKVKTDCHSTGPLAADRTCSCTAEPDPTDFGSYFTGMTLNSVGCF